MAIKNKEVLKDDVMNETVIESPDLVEEPVVEEVVEEPVIEEVVEEPVVEEVVEETTEEVRDESVDNTFIRTDKIGIVGNCDKLNVRAEANISSEVISILHAGAEVLINDEKSTEDFYNISTSAGIEGFCMRGYILK